MPAYPDLPIAPGADIEPRVEHEIDDAGDGSIRMRVMESTESLELSIAHEMLTTAQKNELKQFYRDNKTGTFDIMIADETYTVSFMRRPAFSPDTAGLWDAKVELIGVENEQ